MYTWVDRIPTARRVSCSRTLSWVGSSQQALGWNGGLRSWKGIGIAWKRRANCPSISAFRKWTERQRIRWDSWRSCRCSGSLMLLYTGLKCNTSIWSRCLNITIWMSHWLGVVLKKYQKKSVLDTQCTTFLRLPRSTPQCRPRDCVNMSN